MWPELKEKIIKCNMIGMPLNVEWRSDGFKGKGKLVDIRMTNDYIEFTIMSNKNNNKDTGSFTLGSWKKAVGVIPSKRGMYISSPYMGDIIILPDENIPNKKRTERNSQL